MNRSLLACAAVAAALLAGCSTNSNSAYVKAEPTYEDAQKNPFVSANRDAVQKLLTGLDIKEYQRTPMLVATVVNVNDLRKTAPLGRTLSEQYASHLVNSGLLVKELKLRGDIFVREETGELMLSRELKDIAKLHSAGVVLVGPLTGRQCHVCQPETGDDRHRPDHPWPRLRLAQQCRREQAALGQVTASAASPRKAPTGAFLWI